MPADAASGAPHNPDDWEARLQEYSLDRISRLLNDAADTFHQFNSLPPELRSRIWKAELPSGRVFEPFFDYAHRMAIGQIHQHQPAYTHGTVGPNNNGVTGLVIASHHPVNGQPAPVPRADPAPVYLSITVRAPKIREVCREARRAVMETGRFEFGIFGTQRRGYWFNHASDTVKLSCDLILHPHFSKSLDLSHMQNIAFSHTQFKTEPHCLAAIDIISNLAPRCRTILLFLEQDAGLHHRHSSLTGKSRRHTLQDDDIVGNHAFPPARGLRDGPICWRDLRAVVKAIWIEYAVQRNLDPSRLPEFGGMDIISKSKYH